MKAILFAFGVLLSVLFVSCREKINPDSNNSPMEQRLVSKPWRLIDITDASDRSIPANQLNFETRAIYLFDIQFFSNNVTKAIDRVSRQVVNGGTWYLIDDNRVMDIEVSQFKGKFELKSLTTTRMILINDVPVNGVNQRAQLVFEPVAL